jgi:menaquinone-9 beta-reductase
VDTCDVLIVGGGPAGSSCAWKLRYSGLDVVLLDRALFPRDKICGGWITPEVLTALEIDPAEYARERVLQPISAFRTGLIGGRSVYTEYGGAVSYGIRRREFDHYLIERAGARRIEGRALTSLARTGGGWIANGELRCGIVVGAGGHFCPVAKLTSPKPSRETVVVAQETEFAMNDRQLRACRVEADAPELYFCYDLKGYGWCFRKQNYLNVGLGRMDSHRLHEHVAEFVSFLKSAGRISQHTPALHGHAYLLHGRSPRRLVDDGLLLIGDAAGLAYAQSGEGILPAIQSGLIAARAILDAQGNYAREGLLSYVQSLRETLGNDGEDWTTRLGRHLPDAVIRGVSRVLLSNRQFTREVLLDRWFLHCAARTHACRVPIHGHA